MTPDNSTKGRFGVAEAVYTYLNERRGLPVPLTELVQELGYSRSQISGAVAHIRNGWRLTIEKPRRAVYVLTGERCTDPNCDDSIGSNGHGPLAVVPYEAAAQVIALVDDGRLLVSIEGTVYLAAVLDLSELTPYTAE